KEGNFNLTAEIKEITPAQIAINLERVDIILSPNGKYNLEIIIPEHAEGSYFDREQPLLEINTVEDGKLFLQYTDIQLFIDDYLYQNFNSIYRGRKMYLLDTLDHRITRNFGEIESKYINDFIKYRKAAVLMTANPTKTKLEYFDNQEVLYSQAAYMDVLTELFKPNGRKDDFLSRNWQIAELVEMMNLKKSYYSNPQDKNQVLASLEKMEKSSKSLKNRVVAKNIKKQITELSYDSKAPAFSLKDKNGNTIQLSDYQNDMVILQFVDKITPFVEQEFVSLNELKRQWGDNVKVITISTKEAFDDYLQLFDKQGYKWSLLNLYFNILLLEDYHIKTYPAYVILKKNNLIGMAPAPSPDQYLDYHVKRISQYK
ncbi:MAG: redoxin domain-containing protein, partial [Bacteroidales bacterium]|nr:redoxin domain-containing protein [Bacteroidales bacterium]